MSKNTPAERKLTTKQRALVDTIVANGCSITQAASMAGYASGESGRVTESVQGEQRESWSVLLRVRSQSTYS